MTYCNPKAVISPKSTSLPRPSVQLWIVTYGDVRKPGLSATHYVKIKDDLLFFTAKLRSHQQTWLSRLRACQLQVPSNITTRLLSNLHKAYMFLLTVALVLWPGRSFAVRILCKSKGNDIFIHLKPIPSKCAPRSRSCKPAFGFLQSQCTLSLIHI